MIKRITTGVAVALLLVSLGCDDAQELPGVEEAAILKEAQFVESPQQKANREAVEKARATVGELIAVLEGEADKPRIIEVKVLARDEATGQSEPLPLRDVTYADGKLHGKIDSMPLQLTNYKMDELYSVAPQDIYDWYIIEGKTIRGGYTLRVLRDQMSPEDRRSYDDVLGVTFE